MYRRPSCQAKARASLNSFFSLSPFLLIPRSPAELTNTAQSPLCRYSTKSLLLPSVSPLDSVTLLCFAASTFLSPLPCATCQPCSHLLQGCGTDIIRGVNRPFSSTVGRVICSIRSLPQDARVFFVSPSRIFSLSELLGISDSINFTNLDIYLQTQKSSIRALASLQEFISATAGP
jgi:hypothetical protein